jgi:hypothetical protein
MHVALEYATKYAKQHTPTPLPTRIVLTFRMDGRCIARGVGFEFQMWIGRVSSLGRGYETAAFCGDVPVLCLKATLPLRFRRAHWPS